MSGFHIIHYNFIFFPMIFHVQHIWLKQNVWGFPQRPLWQFGHGSHWHLTVAVVRNQLKWWDSMNWGHQRPQEAGTPLISVWIIPRDSHELKEYERVSDENIKLNTFSYFLLSTRNAGTECAGRFWTLDAWQVLTLCMSIKSYKCIEMRASVASR